MSSTTIQRPITQVVVRTHFATLAPTAQAHFKQYATDCIKSLYELDATVPFVFVEGEPGDPGVNTIQLSVAMSTATKDHLESSLKLIFKTPFALSIGDTSDPAPEAIAKINAVAAHYMLRWEPEQRQLQHAH